MQTIWNTDYVFQKQSCVYIWEIGDRWGVQGGRRNSQWAPLTNYFGDFEILKDLKGKK